MKPSLLLVHNYYQQPGGEDQVFAAEAALLEHHGHKVHRYTVHNDQVSTYSKVALARATIWNADSYDKLRHLIRQVRPDVMHVHNTLPLISPAAYYAAKDEGLAVVQTLHNYRLMCPASTFLRNGQICEDCSGKFFPWPGVIHACYRQSYAASGAIAAMLAIHQGRGTYRTVVDHYIAMTDFGRRKFIESGFPEEKVVVKPHFVEPDPGPGSGGGRYALFAGRLVPEKGVETLLQAWERVSYRLPLKIVGDGPLAPKVAKAAAKNTSITWLGQRAKGEVLALMGEASIVVVPSLWYETFGLVAIEAFAKGTPVIASAIGAIAEVVEAGRTGFHFRPGDAEDLAVQIEWAVTHPLKLAQMRREARAEYDAKYTAESNYPQLVEIYREALRQG